MMHKSGSKSTDQTGGLPQRNMRYYTHMSTKSNATTRSKQDYSMRTRRKSKSNPGMMGY